MRGRDILNRGFTVLGGRLPLVVGLLIGLFLAAVYLLLGRQTAFGSFFVGAFLVVLEAVITGGLHLDGLMDAADGLLGCWSRERARPCRSGALQRQQSRRSSRR